VLAPCVTRRLRSGSSSMWTMTTHAARRGTGRAESAFEGFSALAATLRSAILSAGMRWLVPTLTALAAYADEREAHIREVEQFGQSLPDGSYGRRNQPGHRRSHRTRSHTNATRGLRSPEPMADREIELE
jgi:hypothetical protein